MDRYLTVLYVAAMVLENVHVGVQAAVDKHAASIRVQQRATEAASASASLARQVMRPTSPLILHDTKTGTCKSVMHFLTQQVSCCTQHKTLAQNMHIQGAVYDTQTA